MTAAGQAFLFAGVALCLTFSTIALVYFANRLRSDFLSAWERRRHVRDLGHRMILTLARFRRD